jgi:class 3 adenylate cyclase
VLATDLGSPTSSFAIPGGPAYASQLRLLLESLCCDLVRFEHAGTDGLPADDVRIKHEYPLGEPSRFADIRIEPRGRPPYYMEIDYGLSDAGLLQSLRRKYKPDGPRVREASKLVVVVDTEGQRDRARLETAIRQVVPEHLGVELWTDAGVRERIANHFGVTVPVPSPETLAGIAHQMEQARGFHAFGGDDLAHYTNDPLRSELLWHFGLWRLRELREVEGRLPEDILPQALYRGVAIIMADLCAFSSYVRDTSDEEVIRDNLTAFYSKTRTQIQNDGGMFYQFVGDEVIGLFGIPHNATEVPQRALQTARNLLAIGNSVSNRWQRNIDRAQSARGVHIGMAVGDLQIVSLRPFTRIRMGAIGDALNVAARLMAIAGPSEIVVSNTLFHQLAEEDQAGFAEIDAIECHNVGRINAWRASSPSPA